MIKRSPYVIGVFLLAISMTVFGSSSEVATAQSPTGNADQPAVSVHWPYSVPQPLLDDQSAGASEPRAVDDTVRTRVAEMRRSSEKVIDGFARQMENCRYEATLHFDDRDRSQLIGNDQACQSQYRRAMAEERRSLKRRISEIRGEANNSSLIPVSIK